MEIDTAPETRQMKVLIAAKTAKMIEDSVKAGMFASAEEMVDAAIKNICEPELFGDFAPGEMMHLIEQAEKSGPPIPYETVKANMKAYKEAFIAGRK